MSYEEVEALVGVLQSSATLTELEVRKGDRVVRLRRALTNTGTPARAVAAALAVNSVSPTSGVTISGVGVSPMADNGSTTALVPLSPSEILAPPTRIAAGLVGVFHPSRKVPVVEDQIVDEGQVLGQIEAMRLMNDVVATIGGRILSVLVQDGQPVQYGQPLFEIVPAVSGE